MEFELVRDEKVDDPRVKNAKYMDQTVVKHHKKVFEFARTQFIIDDEYVGDPPKVQVSFENINDNINEKFLTSEISKVGRIRSLHIVRDPSGGHMGLAKVQFETPAEARECVNHYNNRQLMGKVLRVELDVRFEKIERKKEEKLRPSFKPIRQLEPVQSTPAPVSQTFPPTPILPTILPDVDKSINRQHAPGSLLERIAKMGLAQPGSYPPIQPPQAYPFQSKNIMAETQLHQNQKTDRLEKKPITVHQPAPPPSFEEDEDLWNPPTTRLSEEKLYLTDEQIFNEVLPFIIEEYMKELSTKVEFTIRRKIILTSGYPILDKAQSEYKAKQDRIEFEQRRLEQENVNKQREQNAIKATIAAEQLRKNLDERYLGRWSGNLNTENRYRPLVHRHRTNANDILQSRTAMLDNLKRINRSSAFINESREHTRKLSETDEESLGSTHPRSRVRSVSESSESSSDSSSELSVSSRSSSSRSVHYSTPDNASLASSRSSRGRGSPAFRIQVESSDLSTKPAKDEVTAASALLDLKGLPNAPERLASPIEQTKSSKRKLKSTGQENRHLNKRHKSDGPALSQLSDKTVESLKESKTITGFPRRSSQDIEKLENDLDISEEDLKYLKDVHESYEEEHSGPAKTPKIPFGNMTVNKAHLVSEKISIENEIKSNIHPKWWTGCSRCSLIEISDKGKIEETVYDDSQKALIKSHVIQAANSTRRDQRNDQRRMATLNSAIDPSFLKQFTSNTLQMRAKNLRFSRSKIHKWGLFACEKIASGDAVIEYVGEKIRPSVADHREKIVYENLPTHDGSSYFFRVDSDVIDATLKGNKARFINHSCNPNCIAKVIKHENGTNSIVIYAKQAIDEDEEITYDYKFPREEDVNKIKCRCRAPNCQRYLN